MRDRVTLPQIVAAEHKLTMLTAYDFWTAQLVDTGGADMTLVGDSLGMVIQGNENTLSVSVDDIVYHCRAVKRGTKRAFIVGDMPYLSYHISKEASVINAGRIITEGGADAIKLEGGVKRLPMIEAILDAEIPVMGHLGLTPQSVNAMGGFKVQAKCQEAREQLKREALALQNAGVFSIVLECIPYDLAAEVTELLDIPTIGIGAGPHCSGQVLVTHDMLGLGFGKPPKFVRQFAEMGLTGLEAVQAYCQAVQTGEFPKLSESYRPNKKKQPSPDLALYGSQAGPIADATAS
jgi:3-methyl-2-oxobutanoate hydroxymethyltransferase